MISSAVNLLSSPRLAHNKCPSHWHFVHHDLTADPRDTDLHSRFALDPCQSTSAEDDLADKVRQDRVTTWKNVEGDVVDGCADDELFWIFWRNL
jgi:hypothetical protein